MIHGLLLNTGMILIDSSKIPMTEEVNKAKQKTQLQRRYSGFVKMSKMQSHTFFFYVRYPCIGPHVQCVQV